MAKQTGIIRLKGTIGGISFYKTADLAREKGGVDASRIKNDPAFQRTREKGAEFGAAGKGGKVLRNAIRILLQNAKDKRVVSRLTTDLLKIVKTDAVNARGARTVQDGNLDLLKGFEFNTNRKLGCTLFATTVNAFDRVAGDATVSIAPFSSKKRIAAPAGTTHFKMVTGAATIDVFFKYLIIITFKQSLNQVLEPFFLQNVACLIAFFLGIFVFHFLHILILLQKVSNTTLLIFLLLPLWQLNHLFWIVFFYQMHLMQYAYC
jgi:hypothetical protein